MILIQSMSAFWPYTRQWRVLSREYSDYFSYGRNVGNKRGNERSKRGSVQPFIRPFQRSDLDCVCYIESRSFPEPWSELQFKFLHRKNPNGFLVAILNGKVVGYIVAEVAMRLEPRKFRFKKRGHILNIAVYPEFRRKGIGEALVEAIISFLRKKRPEDVWLEVRASNLTAKNFYLRVGFKEKGRKLQYYLCEDAIIMVKKL